MVCPADSPGVTAPAPALAGQEAVVDRRELSSGRTLLVLRGADAAGAPRDELEIRSPDGQPEVRIVFGPHGPEVSLRAARLELDAPTIALRCRDLDVRAEAAVALHGGKSVAITSDGDLRLKSIDDVHMNGAVLRLNCTETDAPAGPPT